MEINLRDLISEISDSVGLHSAYINERDENIEEFDLGFRKKFLIEDPYLSILTLFKEMENDKLYCVEDQFLVRYIVFKIPSDYEKPDICAIGPYVVSDWNLVFEEVSYYNKLTLMQREGIVDFVESLPVLADENSIVSVYGKLFEKIKEEGRPVLVTRIYSRWNDETIDLRQDLSNKEEYNDHEVKHRYQMESIMLDAIVEGNYVKAASIHARFNSSKVTKRYSGDIQTSKMALFTLNTLCRMALQRAEVAPIRIDGLSSKFALRIENCTSVTQLIQVKDTMLKKYCEMARENALKGYSEVIQDTLNYIDFNLSEPLSLSFIAEQLSIDSKALTTKFSKEVGMRLTEYINHKRVQESMKYLTTSNLSILEISEKVGFYDDNYYARIFRKEINMSPSAYRKLKREIAI